MTIESSRSVLSIVYYKNDTNSFATIAMEWLRRGGKTMQEIDYIKIGMRIRQARKAKGWSQDVLAKQCGISMSFMGHIERGTRIMSLDTFVNICMALSVDADELLWGVAHPSDVRLVDMWGRQEKKDTDSYSMYIRIMKSVAEIMNEA